MADRWSNELVIEEMAVARRVGHRDPNGPRLALSSDERDATSDPLDWIYRSAIWRKFAAWNMLTCDPVIATLAVH